MANLPDSLVEAQRILADAVFERNAALRQAPGFRTLNVLGVGIGLKKTDGQPTGLLCLRFYVRQKLPVHEIVPSERVYPLIDGIDTDVVEVAPFVANASPPNRARAAAAAEVAAMRNAVVNEAGMGIQYRTGAGDGGLRGTMGAVLVDSANTRYALSANHVLAENGGPLGLPGFCVADTGSAVSPCIAPPQLIGHKVTYAFLRDQCGADCAMVEAHPGVTLRHVAPPQLSNVSPVAVQPFPGAEVAKAGNTTGFTKGRVTDILADFYLYCGPLGDVRMSRAVLLEDDDPTNGCFDFSHPGDSGSLVFQRTDVGWAPMGLLTAGLNRKPDSRAAEGLGAACPITAVIEALDERMEDPGRRPLRLAEFEAA